MVKVLELRDYFGQYQQAIAFGRTTFQSLNLLIWCIIGLHPDSLLLRFVRLADDVAVKVGAPGISIPMTTRLLKFFRTTRSGDHLVAKSPGSNPMSGSPTTPESGIKSQIAT